MIDIRVPRLKQLGLHISTSETCKCEGNEQAGMGWMGWEMEPFMQLHLRELSASDVPTARYLHHLPM